MIEGTIKFTFDKQELTTSHTFQEDEITKAVNAFNDNLEDGECTSVEVERWGSGNPVINVGGYVITIKTFRELVEEGIIKLT